MIIDRLDRSPLLRSDVNTTGMLYDHNTGQETPGKILKLWGDLRQKVGVIALKKKQGMKFETRAATDLYDQIRAAADELGILIYPHNGKGAGQVVAYGDDEKKGTLADVELTVVAQAIEDGSLLQFYGYGQGADQQDKAGGKAGT